MALIKLTTIRGDEILVNPDFVSDYGTYRCVVSLGQEYMVSESLQQIERMMLRDQFAMSAMSGLLANNSIDDIGAKGISHDAYLFADAMLEERGK